VETWEIFSDIPLPEDEDTVQSITNHIGLE